MTEKQHQLLRGSFLFAQLAPEVVENLCRELTCETFAPGEEIYSLHRFRPAIAILIEGRAEVTNGHGLPMNSLNPGDCFGVAAVFGEVQEYVTTVCAKTSVTLVFCSDDWLRSLFAREPQAAVNYIAFLSGRICFLNHKLDTLTASTALESLCHWLRRNAADQCVEVSGGYTALAKELNLGRASLYRALESLEQSGKIVRDGKRIYLKDDLE